MKNMRITPRKKAAFYFVFVALLIFQHTYMLNTDITAWFLFNFYIAGMVATACVVKIICLLRASSGK